MKPPAGLIEVHGEIKLSTFYYKGGLSDADTVKLDLENGSAKFRANKNTRWKDVTNLLLQARIGSKQVIKTYKNTKVKRLTVRLQGLDASELHYRADSRGLSKNIRSRWNNSEFRQHWAARSVKELVNKMQEYQEQGTIKAHAFSRVDYPNDIFDVYGRFVGDVVIKHNGKRDLNINHWLVQKGWAFPAFYNSMTKNEICYLIEKSKEPPNKKGIWDDHTKRLVRFNFNLKFEKNHTIDHTKDKGGVNFPKIFRRQVKFEVGKKAGAYNETNLSDYLNRSSSKDYCYETDEFLRKRDNATKYPIGKFVTRTGTIKFEPHEIVVIEDTSIDLKDRSGKVIESWDHI